MLRNIVFCIAAFTTLEATAELKVINPSSVCQMLADSGLKGRKWVDYGDGTFGCASDYKDIGSGSPLANNLAFYASGSAQTVRQVKLVMNANKPSAAAPAVKQLVKASSNLSEKVLGAGLSDDLKMAISKGVPTTASVGEGSVEVVKDVWPTGRGYEIQVIIK